jgi:hypothetical protein
MKPPKDLGKAIKAGYMPMFMTGPEIKEHFAPYEGDRKEVENRPSDSPIGPDETDKELWARKLKEAKQTGEERFGKFAFEKSGNSWRSLSGPDLARKGIGPKTSLESVAKEKGLSGVIHVQERVGYPSDKQQLLGGHHRVALSAEQFPEHIFPISYAKNLDDAQSDKNYQ